MSDWREGSIRAASRIVLSRLALFWERAWPMLWPASGIAKAKKIAYRTLPSSPAQTDTSTMAHDLKAGACRAEIQAMIVSLIVACAEPALRIEAAISSISVLSDWKKRDYGCSAVDSGPKATINSTQWAIGGDQPPKADRRLYDRRRSRSFFRRDEWCG